MSYQVLARKWRPANFEQMVGQEHVVQALVNALDGDRLHHAYLFSGTRGVGKTTVARIFAKSLNCEQGISAKPCGECASCVEIDAGRSVDLIEIDAASRTGVDDMRELLDNVQYAPTHGRFKIYLIDEVHMLSRHSFNALLKTLEEPPPHIKFLLATTDPQKIPVTVLSRCLQFSLKRMSRAQILSHLQFLTEQEQITTDASALAQLAAAADGSMRDALSLLDQAIGYGAGEVLASTVEPMLGTLSHDYVLRLLDALQEQDAAQLLGAARSVIEHNPDYQRVCADMIELLQNIAFYQVTPKLSESMDIDPEMLQKYAEQWSAEEIQLYYQILLQGRQDLLIAPDAAAAFEMLMLRLYAFSPQSAESPETLKKKPDNRPARVASELTPGTEPAEIAKRETPLTQPEAEPVVPASQETPAANRPETEPADSAKPEDIGTPDSRQTPLAETSVGKVDTPAIANWTELVYELGLGGLAQEIVANSVAVSLQDECLQLALPTEIHELLNERNSDEIREALERNLGVSFSLQWKACAEPAGVTPLQAKIDRERQERETAIDEIKRDELVLKLQRTLAAELDETSVVRIENNGKDEVKS